MGSTTMEFLQTTKQPALTYQESVRGLLREFAWNPWFLNSYWPENEPRIRFMAGLALDKFPDTTGRRILEVGCANGYVAYLFRLLGFDVAAVDAYEDEKRTELFRQGGVSYQETNLNVVEPLGEFASESFDLILLGEVFEHILNSPTGLLRNILRLLRPGGMLILTTPNPSTFMNAVRLLRDRYVLWGTAEFLTMTKVDEGRIIDWGDIHYREYPASVVSDSLTNVGYRVAGVKYLRVGNAPAHSFSKRIIKWFIYILGLSRLRLFSPGYVVWAHKPT